MIGIIAQYPSYFLSSWRALNLGQITPLRLLIFVVILVSLEPFAPAALEKLDALLEAQLYELDVTLDAAGAIDVADRPS